MRKKGVPNKQKTYKLPKDVKYKDPLPTIYNKETKLWFIDATYGDFESSVKALHKAKASTHPKAIQDRKETTCLRLYGITNAGATVESRDKARATMMTLYGVKNALENKDLLQKSKDTLFKNFGVDNPVKHPDIFLKNRAAIIKSGKTTANTSHMERELRDFIRSLGFPEATNHWLKSDKGRPQELDVYVKEKNIAVEFNGLRYHTSRFKEKNYHLDKTELCEKNNIQLVHIFEHTWKNRKYQVKSFLKSKFGANQIKLNARDCEVRTTPFIEARDFLNKYHILGYGNFTEALGLYHKNELVCMVTIGKHHAVNDYDGYVLKRFIGKENITVRGGLDRLCKHAAAKYGDIITWIDRCISDGKGWEKCGWIKEEILRRDYFYYNTKTRKVVNKRKRRRDVVNTPKDMSEEEHATLDGLERVYDCGKIRLRFNYAKIIKKAS